MEYHHNPALFPAPTSSAGAFNFEEFTPANEGDAPFAFPANATATNPTGAAAHSCSSTQQRFIPPPPGATYESSESTWNFPPVCLPPPSQYPAYDPWVSSPISSGDTSSYEPESESALQPPSPPERVTIRRSLRTRQSLPAVAQSTPSPAGRRSKRKVQEVDSSEEVLPISSGRRTRKPNKPNANKVCIPHLPSSRQLADASTRRSTKERPRYASFASRPYTAKSHRGTATFAKLIPTESHPNSTASIPSAPRKPKRSN